jgi:hypothetical protein
VTYTVSILGKVSKAVFTDDAEASAEMHVVEDHEYNVDL